MKMFFISVIMILFSEIVFCQQIRFGLDPGFALSRGDYRPHEGLDRRIIGRDDDTPRDANYQWRDLHQFLTI